MMPMDTPNDAATNDATNDATNAASTGHHRTWDLIPWVVNGRASAAERQVVAAHVAGCEDCRDELAFQHGLRDGMADAPPPPPVAPALRRFWAHVDAQGAPDGAARGLHPHAFDGVPLGPRRWPRALAAVAVLQAVGLAVLAGVLWERPRAAPYETLSRNAPAVTAATLRVVPAPALPVGELRALLARSGVQLVETSADGGIFGAVVHPQAGLSVDQALQRLRAEPGVLLAEPVPAAP